MSVCPDCGNTGLRPIEQGPAGATYTVLGRCKCQTPTVTIPRAQYDALMAVAKDAEAVCETAPKDYKLRRWNEYTELCLKVAALRAGGIVEDKT